jgi:hypothetical protein
MYKELREESKGLRTLMLDNGAFERGVPIDSVSYLQLIEELRPDVIVLPDVVNNIHDTMQATEAFLKEHLPRVTEILQGAFTLMGVLQGTSPNEYLSMLDYYSRTSSDISIIGIPYHLFYRPKFIKKYNVHEICQQRNLDIHILGLPNPFEVVDLQKFSQVTSIDTSLPVVSAYADRRFKHLQWMSHPLNIDALHNDEVQEISVENIQVLKAMCQLRQDAALTLQIRHNNV